MPAHWPPTTGDADAQTERWTLTGVTSTFSDQGMFHVTITASTVDVYRDVDRGASDKVATGSHSQPTTWTKITLSASNASGLTGSLYLKWSTGANATIRVFPTLATDAELLVLNTQLADWPKSSGLTFEDQHQKARKDFVRLALQRFPPIVGFGATRLAGTLRGQLMGDVWRVNSVGDFEMCRLQNPEDFREWALHHTLEIIYQTPNRILPQEEQKEMQEAEREAAERAWSEVYPRVDIDMDGDADSTVPRFRLARG